MKRHPHFKADLVVFGILIFLMGMAFSVFVLEKDPEARLGLFGISVWVLVMAAAFYTRIKRKEREAKAREAKELEKKES